MAGGTTYAYSHLGYNPDGTMLVSQGKEPDHLITIWNWKAEHIILRVKSHGQDVFNAEFSQFEPGQLTSCGLGHIKFWKMAKTFTGLKLQGELGRFGKTEICDIIGICAMPDEKVISGSEWGNLLVWDDRLIKLEIRQKALGNCHGAAISQILYNEHTEDIISVGMDGWIKIWTRATIDVADPPDEADWYLEMQPLFELHVKDQLSSAKLMSICKKNSDSEDLDWFAQDGDGGIWAVRLYNEDKQPERLFTSHAGEVAAMAASPIGYYLATLGSNGRLLIHDVANQKLLASRQFKAGGSALLWMPVHVEPSGALFVGGFCDGMIRMFVASLRELQRALRSSSTTLLASKGSSTKSAVKTDEYINLIQKVKAHSSTITSLCLNPRGSILVSGSKDKKIFIHQILPTREYICLSPVGFVELSAPITYVTWMPKQTATAIVACADGNLVEVALPERTLTVSTSYNLSLDYRVITFKSIKSEILRAIELEEIADRIERKRQKKMNELQKIKAENPLLNIDEERFLADSEEGLELPPLYVPETPSPILFVILLPNNNLILSMGSYDCGYLYEYSFETGGLVKYYMVPEALNTPVTSFLPLCDGNLIAFGMANGVIRLYNCEEGMPNFTSFYYDIPMHDPEHGAIRSLCTSTSETYLYSCGGDGNVFTYTIDPTALVKPDGSYTAQVPAKSRTTMIISGPIPREIVADSFGDDELSLEETKMNADRLNQLKLANEHKEFVRRKLANLRIRFEYLMNRNDMLPPSQTIPKSEFELDSRITSALQEKIADDMALMLRKMAYRVTKSRQLVKKMQNHFVDVIASLDVTIRAIKNDALRVKAFTHNKLTPEFLRAEQTMKKILNIKDTKSKLKMAVSSRLHASMSSTGGRQSVVDVDTFMKQPFCTKLTLKGRKAFYKQMALKRKKDIRAAQWQVFLDTKPNINEDDPDDVLEFEIASKTIGDFKLKSADSYKVPEDKRITPPQKYWQMLCLHREIYELKNSFNEKVCQVRDLKITLVRRFKQLYHDLDCIQRELTPDQRRGRLPIPTCWLKNNFPEHIFRLEFGADPTIYHPVSDPFDEEYYVLRKDMMEEPEEYPTDHRLSSLRWAGSLIDRELQSKGEDDITDTPWELELKVKRMTRLLHRQEKIIHEMESKINDFDEKLEALSIERLKFARDIKLMEIFMLTLHEELIVINSYAGLEDEITGRINKAVVTRNEKLVQKNNLEDAIESKQAEVSMLQQDINSLYEEVTERLTNNKWAPFLHRVFKKKRVNKRYSDSDSMASTSESDDDDEDFDEDNDNEDYIPIKLDENVCPEGCDPLLFNLILQFRNKRYNYEDTIADLKTQLDSGQRDLQMFSSKLSALEEEVHRITRELEAVQFEKQQKLNDIETVVVLNLSQFRHFVTASRPEDGLVQNPLVFASEALTTLAGRVKELEKDVEIEELKIKQQKSLMQRLDRRRKEMKEIKKSLKKEIDEEIFKKFGEMIDVERMEMAVLMKMISQARRDYAESVMRKKYDKTFKRLRHQLYDRIDELIRVERENTRRLRIQTVLQRETVILNDILRFQNTKRESIGNLTDTEMFEKDIQQLEDMLKEQLDVNVELKEEIKVLSYKCTPPVTPKKTVQRSCVKEAAVEEKHEEQVEGEEEIIEEEEEGSEEASEEVIEMVDKVLVRLASGSSAYDVAVSIVDDLLRLADEKTRSSALDCAMKLVEELIVITTQDRGDVTVVEKYAEELQSMAATSEEQPEQSATSTKDEMELQVTEEKSEVELLEQSMSESELKTIDFEEPGDEMAKAVIFHTTRADDDVAPEDFMDEENVP